MQGEGKGLAGRSDQNGAAPARKFPALGPRLFEDVRAASANLVLPGQIDIGSATAHLVSRDDQPVIERSTAASRREIEICSPHDAYALGRSRLGKSRNRLDGGSGDERRNGHDLQSLFHRSPPVGMRPAI